jgi:hypothetical protein
MSSLKYFKPILLQAICLISLLVVLQRPPYAHALMDSGNSSQKFFYCNLWSQTDCSETLIAEASSQVSEQSSENKPSTLKKKSKGGSKKQKDLETLEKEAARGGPCPPGWNTCLCPEVHGTDCHRSGYGCGTWRKKVPCEDDYRCTKAKELEKAKTGENHAESSKGKQENQEEIAVGEKGYQQREIDDIMKKVDKSRVAILNLSLRDNKENWGYFVDEDGDGKFRKGNYRNPKGDAVLIKNGDEYHLLRFLYEDRGAEFLSRDDNGFRYLTPFSEKTRVHIETMPRIPASDARGNKVDQDQFMDTYVDYVNAELDADLYKVPDDEIRSTLIDYNITFPLIDLIKGVLLVTAVEGLVSPALSPAGQVALKGAAEAKHAMEVIESAKPAFETLFRNLDKERLVKNYERLGMSHELAERDATRLINYISARKKQMTAFERLKIFYPEL